MSIVRSIFLKSNVMTVALATLLMVSASPETFAQAWPSARPVKVIVPSAPGGSSDPLARLMAEELGGALGGNLIVENRERVVNVVVV